MIFSKNSINFLFILLICTVISLSFVHANDMNSTEMTISDEIESDGPGIDDVSDEKQTPVIRVNTTEIITGESVELQLKDSNNNSLTNKTLKTIIDKEINSFVTDENGVISLKLELPSKKYILNVIFEGDDDFNQFNTTFNINVLKMDSVIKPVSTTVINGNYFYAHLTDINGNPITGASVTYNINGKKYTSNTNSNGRSGFKINLAGNSYSLNIDYDGNEYYNSISQTIDLIVRSTTSLVVGNSILLTEGYLRIYLKSSDYGAISGKKVKITINDKVFTKKTNSEGIIIFKPKVGTGQLTVKVEFDGTTYAVDCEAVKTVSGIKGSPKNPLKSKIPLKNGIPNVDYMTGSFVMADEDMKYTVTKAQYREVIKRDSYCLYLNKKLSKYTFFKSKAEPKYNHIIKREKWNVIERAINTKIVKKNKHGYWPSQVTVSLKGKSYTYPEVRDEQNTGYTCGPTSASMCSQALRNYYCEKYITKKGDTTPSEGSSTRGLKKALEKCHFKCSIYYKSSFSKALKHLKKGGCALIFHTWNHYVSILDISKDGKKVLVGNPSGDYDYGSHKIPTKWLTVKYMKKRFNNYDTSGLIVKLKYSLSKTTKKKINNYYSSMGTKWARQNTKERIPQI